MPSIVGAGWGVPWAFLDGRPIGPILLPVSEETAPACFSFSPGWAFLLKADPPSLNTREALTMSKQVRSFLLILVGSAAIGAGCSSAEAPGGAGGKGGGGSVGTGMAIALTPDATGYIDVMTNTLGIKGAWYAYGDGAGETGMPPGDCQKAGHTVCSTIAKPAAGTGFANTAGKMCTMGTIAVVADIVGMPGTPDYSKIWGAGIGVDLNHEGIMPKGEFNATAAGVVGFSFDLDAKPLAGIRVEVEATGTLGAEAGNDYWGATSSYPASPVVIGTNTVMWGDIKGPKGHVFDQAAQGAIRGLQFHVPASTSGGGTYEFCISNLKMLK
ncbi:MAG: hypothetical protein ABUS79_04300 [Pseudomonadota bacterium]